jgi:hypothetical protein
MKIPASILKRLYVKNSLANQDDGFSFKIKNSLSNGTQMERFQQQKSQNRALS